MFKTIFLDLDNTIFSFDQMYERSSYQAIQQIMGFDRLGVDFDSFYRKFREIADRLYVDFEEGRRSIDSYHDERWIQAFAYFGVELKDKTLGELNHFIQENYLHFVEPFEGARSFLQKLIQSHKVGLITNGPVDMQMAKLIKMDMVDFFDPNLLIISEKIGISKPHPKIFHTALAHAGIEAHEALHIGDSIKHDIVGANEVGIASGLIHRKHTSTHEAPTYQFDDFFAAARVLLD